MRSQHDREICSLKDREKGERWESILSVTLGGKEEKCPAVMPQEDSEFWDKTVEEVNRIGKAVHIVEIPS